MGLLKLVFTSLTLIALTGLCIVVIPGIPPDIEPEAFDIQPPRKLDGWFATNTILDEAEVYFETPVGGTESLAVFEDDTIITGDASGAIFKITGKQRAEPVTRLGYPCDIHKSTEGMRLCGWPLGMRIVDWKYLMTMDYYGGLVKVEIDTGSYETIIPKSRPINEKIGLVPEDFDIAKDGTIYWTDGSTNGNFFLEMIGQPSGRLMKYDPKSRTNQVLMENLYFSNGVCLSDDEEFVLVVDSGRAKISRYYLKGPKKGETDTFIDGLPGYPDNLRSNGRGGFYVPLIVPWNDQFSMRLHLLSNRPLLRKLILRSRYILLSVISYLKTFFPNNTYLLTAEQAVEENEPILNLRSMPKTATVVELSKTGEIIGVLNGKNGKISGVSHISVGKNYAFLTGPFAGKVWRIKLDTLRRMQ